MRTLSVTTKLEDDQQKLIVKTCKIDWIKIKDDQQKLSTLSVILNNELFINTRFKNQLENMLHFKKNISEYAKIATDNWIMNYLWRLHH